jgi:filamentous hemagglutinin
MVNFDPMYTYIGYDSEYGSYIFYDPYSEGGQRGYFVSTAGLDLDRYRQIMNGDLPSEIQKLGVIDNKINAIEQEKSNVNKTINLLNNKTNGYEHAESKFSIIQEILH